MNIIVNSGRLFSSITVFRQSGEYFHTEIPVVLLQLYCVAKAVQDCSLFFASRGIHGIPLEDDVITIVLSNAYYYSQGRMNALVLILFQTFPGAAGDGSRASQSPTASADGSHGSRGSQGSHIEWGPVLSSFACLTADGDSEEWNPDDDRRQRRVRIRSPSNASSLPDSLRENDLGDRPQVREREGSNASSLPWSLVDGQDERTRLSDEGKLRARLSDEGKLSESTEKSGSSYGSPQRPPTRATRIMVPKATSTTSAKGSVLPSTPLSLERALAMSRLRTAPGELTPVAETNAEDGSGFFSDSESDVSSVLSSTLSGSGQGARKPSRDPATLLAAAVEKARQVAGIPPPTSRSMAHAGKLSQLDEDPVELPSTFGKGEATLEVDTEGSDGGRPVIAATLAAEAMVAFEKRKNKKVVLSPLPGKVDKMSKFEKVEGEESDVIMDAVMEDAFGSEPRTSLGGESLAAMSTHRLSEARTSWSSESSFAVDGEDVLNGETKSQASSGPRVIPPPASRGTGEEFSLMGALSALLGGKRVSDPAPTVIDGSGSPRVSLAARASPDVGVESDAVVNVEDSEEKLHDVDVSSVMLVSPGVAGGDSKAGKMRPKAGSAEEAFETAAAILRKRKAEEAATAAAAVGEVGHEKGGKERGGGGGRFSLMGALSNFLSGRAPEPAPAVVDGSGSPRARFSASSVSEQWPDDVVGPSDADGKRKLAASSSMVPANSRVEAEGSKFAKQRPRAGPADEAFEIAAAIPSKGRAEEEAVAAATAKGMQLSGRVQSNVRVGGDNEVEEVKKPVKVTVSPARVELPALVVKREDEDGELLWVELILRYFDISLTLFRLAVSVCPLWF